MLSASTPCSSARHAGWITRSRLSGVRGCGRVSGFAGGHLTNLHCTSSVGTYSVRLPFRLEGRQWQPNMRPRPGTRSTRGSPPERAETRGGRQTRPSKPDGVLIRVRAASVNPLRLATLLRGEAFIIRALDGDGASGARRMRRDGCRLRRDRRVGRRARETFRPGDEVFARGHGGVRRVRLHREPAVAQKPASLTFEQAAAIPAAGHHRARGAPRAREVPARPTGPINGAAGGVGTFAVQIAKSSVRKSPASVARASSTSCARSAPTRWSTTRARTSHCAASATTSSSTSLGTTRGGLHRRVLVPSPARSWSSACRPATT